MSRPGASNPPRLRKKSRQASTRRQGPRPLLLHLSMASGLWTSSFAALALSKLGSLPWKPDLRAEGESLAALLGADNTPEGPAALDSEVRARLDGFLSGIERYRGHPYRRRLTDPPVLWAQGSTRLLDFRRAGHSASAAPAVVLVPSLVNRSTILDLSARRSLARFLARRGLGCFLLDWGAPGAAEREFGLSEYVDRRLVPALRAASRANGRPVVAAGYCMGGILALAGAQQAPESVAALALLATPWDFQAGAPLQSRAVQAATPLLRWWIEAQGGLPVDALQTMFAWVDPLAVSRKFRAFARLPEASERVRDFVAVEDWLNDGVPLTARVAEEAICGWLGGNEPARGAWTIGGAPVLPEAFDKPVIAFVPLRDRLVPPASALALVRALPQATLVEVATGHIGMVAGGGAVAGLYRPLAAWVASLP